MCFGVCLPTSGLEILFKFYVIWHEPYIIGCHPSIVLLMSYDNNMWTRELVCYTAAAQFRVLK
jgi:hypothetical protein